MQPLITQLQVKVSTGKSQSPTSNILLRNYATENCCV